MTVLVLTTEKYFILHIKLLLIKRINNYTTISHKVLINDDFLKHKQANIKVNSRRFAVIVTPFSRQSK